MTDSSAIPGNLFTYSANNTGRADTLNKWISTVLTPAIAAYRSGAVDYGADIVGISTGSEPLDTSVQGGLARAKQTDERVRFTAIAFQEAGSQGATMTLANGGVPYLPGKAPVPTAPWAVGAIDWNNTIVHTDDGKLDTIAYQDGVRAAGQLEFYWDKSGGPDYNGFFGQIKDRADDPSFAAGFFNSLKPARITMLLKYEQYSSQYNQYGQRVPPPSMAPFWTTFASALASGHLDPKIEAEVVAGALKYDAGDDLALPMLQSIGENPAAAKAFVASLYNGTLPDGTLKAMFGDIQQQKATLAILTTDLSVNPSDGDRLMKSVTELLIHYPDGKEGSVEDARLTISSPDMEEIQPDVSLFLRAYMASRMQSPPANANGLQDWAEGIGKDMRLLWPFYHAIVNTAAKENLDAEKANEFAKGFLTTILLAGPAELLAPEEGAGIVGGEVLDQLLTKLAFGGTAGGVVYQAEPYATEGLKKLAELFFGGSDSEHPSEDLNGALRNYTALYMAQQLYQHGMIVDKNGNVISWDKVSGGAGLDGLITKIGPDVSASDWLKQQYLKIPGEDESGALQNLQTVINETLAVESNHPTGGG